MIQTPWVTEKEACNQLGVAESTLQFWREVGYLKPGTHWRNYYEGEKISLKPKILYHIRWSKEVIEYWKNHDAPIVESA